MSRSLVAEKSYGFALDVVRLARTLDRGVERELARQLLRAGTSVGANAEEASAAQSRRDVLAKMSIASKEAREARYWLRLLRDSGTVAEQRITPLLAEAEELIRMLTSIVKSTRERS